jgi:hypothetical protein
MHLKHLLAVLAAAALLAPAAASAVPPQEIDDIGNTTNDPTIEVDDPDGDGTITIDTSGTGGGSSSCDYTVKGRLTVRNPVIDGLDDGDPIKGVKIAVSGRSYAGIYNEWAEVMTGPDGRFTVDKHECNPRKIKVEARFESDDLRVTGSGSVGWYLLKETTSTIEPGTLDLGDEPFGGETGDQSTTQARTDAQTWMIYRKALDHTASIGFPFLNKVTAHNPATLTTGGMSATDPILQDIHIDPSDTNSIDVLLHELGHAWMYPHVSGEGCLTWTALMSGGTHAAQTSSCVAFNEGFAEFFADKLEQELNTAGQINSVEGLSTTPFNRAELEQTYGLDDLTEVSQRDVGWEGVFRVLTTGDITRQLFGLRTDTPGVVAPFSPTGCSGQPTTLDDLADALNVIGTGMDVSGVSAASLLGRADNRLSAFDSADATAYMNAIDPSKTSEPHTAYGC